MLPSESRFFLSAIIDISLQKHVRKTIIYFIKFQSQNIYFKNTAEPPPPTPRLIIEWCFYNSHLAHARRCIHMVLYI